jgi:hypothetical protein
MAGAPNVVRSTILRSTRSPRRRVVSIPNSNIIYAVAGLGSSARSRCSTSTGCAERVSTAPAVIAASTFLDIFNAYLLLLDLFARA